MDRLTYLTYRDGKHDDIEVRIREAVSDFYHRLGMPPVVIAVNPRETDAAQEALEALDLKVPLEPNPGCLIPEVWLGVEGEVER